MLFIIGKQILDNRFHEIKDAISSGIVDESKPVGKLFTLYIYSYISLIKPAGLLDQWLIEGKFTKDEALSLSCDMLAAGIDTVSLLSSCFCCHACMHG